MFTQAIVGNINYMITPNQMLFMSPVNNLEFMLNSYRRVTPKPTLGIPALANGLYPRVLTRLFLDPGATY